LEKEGNMENNFWCANFDMKPCLEHGIANNLWLMQYQYEDDHGHTYQGDKKAAIRKNWERLGEIRSGDYLVAYLKPNTFFAIGEVRTPRRPQTKKDHSDTIGEYLDRRRSHQHKTGFVYYSPVLYENFSDKWELPSKDKGPEHKAETVRYPQRIDVKKWENYVQGGMRVNGLLSVVKPYELQKAVFRIPKEVFCRIRDELAGGTIAEDLKEIRRQNIRATDKQALVSARVGQGQFRTSVLEMWDNRCAVTGSRTLSAIRASHIRAWREAANDERLDPKNGLPLVASIDALFDGGLISFQSSGKMIVSPKVNKAERQIFGLANASLRKKPTARTAKYLAFHRRKHGFE
jgi:hypothetical protein